MSHASKLVLIVEDDEDVSISLCDILEDAGFDCWLAWNCDEAVGRLAREGRMPDAVLLDANMPGMPFTAFIAHVRRREGTPRPRIVLATAAAHSQIPGDLDVDATLFKPFGMHTLLATLERVLAPMDPKPPAHAA